MQISDLSQIRIKTFEQQYQNKSKFNASIDKTFKCVTHKLSGTYKCKLVLDLFELILYVNYKANSRVITKCDLDKILLHNTSKYADLAKELLGSIYKVRNDFAHNSLTIGKSYKQLESTLNDITTMTSMMGCLRLLMPGEYVHRARNIYYIVDRGENPIYVELQRLILKQVDNADVKGDVDYVSIVNKLSDMYNTDVLNTCVVDVVSQVANTYALSRIENNPLDDWK